MREKEDFSPSLSVSGHLGTGFFVGDSAAGSFRSLSQPPPILREDSERECLPESRKRGPEFSRPASG